MRGTLYSLCVSVSLGLMSTTENRYRKRRSSGPFGPSDSRQAHELVFNSLKSENEVGQWGEDPAGNFHSAEADSEYTKLVRQTADLLAGLRSRHGDLNGGTTFIQSFHSLQDEEQEALAASPHLPPAAKDEVAGSDRLLLPPTDVAGSVCYSTGKSSCVALNAPSPTEGKKDHTFTPYSGRQESSMPASSCKEVEHQLCELFTYLHMFFS